MLARNTMERSFSRSVNLFLMLAAEPRSLHEFLCSRSVLFSPMRPWSVPLICLRGFISCERLHPLWTNVCDFCSCFSVELLIRVCFFLFFHFLLSSFSSLSDITSKWHQSVEAYLSIFTNIRLFCLKAIWSVSVCQTRLLGHLLLLFVQTDWLIGLFSLYPIGESDCS